MTKKRTVGNPSNEKRPSSLVFSSVLCLSIIVLSLTGAKVQAAVQCELPDLAQIRTELNKNITRFKLKNGLDVVYFRDPDSPTAAIRTLVNVGSRDEQQAKTGYAHLFEHMFFEGTDKVPNDGFRQITKRAGASTNASTYFDRTDYYGTLPSEQLPGLIWLDGDRLGQLKVSEETLAIQKAAVLEEKAMTVDNVPYASAAMNYFPTLFKGTPYQHFVIGQNDDVQRASTEDLSSFLSTYYGASNMVLALSSSQEPGDIQQMISKSFGNLPKGVKHPQPELHSVSLPQQRHVELQDPLAPYPIYLFVWPSVGINHEDSVFHYLLWQLLSRELQIELRDLSVTLAHQSISGRFRVAGVNALGVAPRLAADLDDVRQKVSSVVNGNRWLSEQSLCSQIKRTLALQLSGVSKPLSLVSQMSNGALYQDDPLYFIKVFEKEQVFNLEKYKKLIKEFYQQEPLVIEVSPGGMVNFGKSLASWLPRSVIDSLESWTLKKVAND